MLAILNPGPIYLIAMQTLAIVHLDTTAGAMRVTVSEDNDGTLIAERRGAQIPHTYPVKVGQMPRTDESIDEDASELVKIAIGEIETFAEVTGAKQIKVS